MNIQTIQYLPIFFSEILILCMIINITVTMVIVTVAANKNSPEIKLII